MTKLDILAASAAAAALFSSPALARPMTAQDLQSMHRMGSLAVSPDGRVAPNNVDLGIEKFNSARNARFPLGLQRLDHRTQSRSSELVFYQTMGAA